jgi:hypothetical protein
MIRHLSYYSTPNIGMTPSPNRRNRRPCHKSKKQAMGLLDLAVIVARAKGVITAPDQHVFEDARLRIVYSSTAPQALDVFRRGDLVLKVLSVIWNDGGDAVVVLHRSGSWEDYLKRVAKGYL